MGLFSVIFFMPFNCLLCCEREKKKGREGLRLRVAVRIVLNSDWKSDGKGENKNICV